MTLLTEGYALQIAIAVPCYAEFAGALQTLRRGLRRPQLSTSSRCSGGHARIPNTVRTPPCLVKRVR